jgi:predicted nucleotidyltransferase
MESTQKEGIKELAKEFNLKLVLLFGSQSSSKTHKESDIDFAVLPEKGLTFEQEISLNTKLSGLFGDAKIIDLINLRKVNPLLRYEIAKNSLLIYGKEKEFLGFKALAFRSYIEHLPLLALENLLIKKRQRLFAESIYGK